MLQTSSQVRIDGIEETTPGSNMSDTNHLDSKVREVFNHLGIETNTSFIERIGKPRRAPKREQPSPQRPRTALVTVSTSWDAKRILDRADLLKDFKSRVYISAALTKQEEEIENELLKKKRELIKNGEKKDNIRIRNLKLFVNDTEIKLQAPTEKIREAKSADSWLIVNQSLHISCFNVRSLISKKRRNTLSKAALLSNSEILALTETWLIQDIASNEIGMAEYQIYRLDRKYTTKSRHGGVLLAIKENMPHKLYEKLNNIEDAVGCTIDDTLLVVCVYNRPENSPYRWPISKLENSVEASRNSKVPKLVITGEATCQKQTGNPSSENQYEAPVLQALEKLHVSQEIRIPTFDQATLDVLLCNDDFVVRANHDGILNAKYSIDGRAASTTKQSKWKYTSNTTPRTGPQ